MSITIGSLTLTDPTRSQMQETTADNVAYSCSASTPSPTYTDTLEIYYGSLSYEWSFSDGGSAGGASGSHTFTGLPKGSPVTLTARVTVRCVKTVRTRYWITDGYNFPITNEDGSTSYIWIDTSHWSEWSTTTTNIHASSSVSQDANTHPGKCTAFSSLQAGQIIEEALTPGKVGEWCTHCGKWLSWKHQANRYSDADSCTVNSKAWITADWYNNCVRVAEAGDVCSMVSGGPNGTIIAASLFHDLDAAISRRV